MERNEKFSIDGIKEISVRLAYAQIEIYADNVEQIQLIASGDEHSVNELRIVEADGKLEIEQPQYGLSLDITHGHWMELCMRIPKQWEGILHASTISGSLRASEIGCTDLKLETITGDLKVSNSTADSITVKTTAGTVCGKHLMAKTIKSRTVSGDMELESISADTYRFISASGNIIVDTNTAFQQIELRTVSGDFELHTAADAVRLLSRTVSGHNSIHNVKLTDDAGAPELRMIGVSGNLKINGKQES